LKVIVPGASGFIGKNLILKFPKAWEVVAFYNESRSFLDFLKKYNCFNVKAIKVDLSKEKCINNILKNIDINYDCCVYLAANGDPAVSSKNPLFDLSANTVTLINFLENFRIRRFIYFSSGAVYDGFDGFVSPESEVDPTLPYGISNLASEQYVKFYRYRRKSISEYVIVRFFGAYGPFEPERKIYTKLVKTFGVRKTNTFTIRGDGSNFIDAMYVDDAIQGIIKIIKSKSSDLTIDFASCTPITINELVKKTAIVFGISNLEITHKANVPEYIKFRASDHQMRDTLGFKPNISLSDGLERFLKFMLKESV